MEKMQIKKLSPIEIVEKQEKMNIEKSLQKAQGIIVGSIVKVSYLSVVLNKKPKSKKAKETAERKRDKTKFQGVVTAISRKSSTIRVLKISKDLGHRIEKIFPLCSPNIDIELLRQPAKKPRRAKLFYLRERSGKNARI